MAQPRGPLTGTAKPMADAPVVAAASAGHLNLGDGMAAAHTVFAVFGGHTS